MRAVRFEGGLHVPEITYDAKHDRTVPRAELVDLYVRAAKHARLAPAIEDGRAVRLADGTLVLFHESKHASWWVSATPKTPPSAAWIERLDGLVLALAGSSGLEAIAVVRDGGFDLEPQPLIARRTHVVVTTDGEVDACYSDPGVFWAAWDRVETRGAVKVCTRAIDAIDELAWLRRTFEHSMAMVRAARRRGTLYSLGKSSELEELRPWTGRKRALEEHHYDPESRTLELRFIGPEHVTIADLRHVQRAMSHRRDEKDRAVARLVVRFPDEAAARREGRPLLDHGARVVFDGGELPPDRPVFGGMRFRSEPGPGVRVEDVPYKDEALRLRLGGGEITLSFSGEKATLHAASRSDGVRFVEELARQLGIPFAPERDGPPPTRVKLEARFGFRQHPTLGRMWQYEVTLGGTRKAPIALVLSRYDDASWFVLDHMQPAPDAVVQRLGSLLAPPAGAGEARRAFTTEPALLAEILGPYAWSRGGTLWASLPRDRSCAIVCWRADATAPMQITSVPGAVDHLLPSPAGEWLAVVTCVGAPASDGTHTSAQPSEIWLVSAAGAARKLVDSPADPFGIAWSPDGERLAVGGVYGAPRLRVLAADGTVLEDVKPNGSSSWIRGWTAEGVVASVGRDEADADRQMVYRQGAWNVMERVWWAGPGARTEVSVDGHTLHARGEAFGSYTATGAHARDVERIAAGGPTWCGPHHIVLGSDVLALISRELTRITDATDHVHHVAANHDGSVVVWRDARYRVWRARTRVGR